MLSQAILSDANSFFSVESSVRFLAFYILSHGIFLMHHSEFMHRHASTIYTHILTLEQTGHVVNSSWFSYKQKSH